MFSKSRTVPTLVLSGFFAVSGNAFANDTFSSWFSQIDSKWNTGSVTTNVGTNINNIFTQPFGGFFKPPVVDEGQRYGLNPSIEHYDLKLLGKFIFFDKISSPSNVMSCASCHGPSAGGAGPSSFINATQVAMNGAKWGRVGSMRPPTNTYASGITPFQTGCSVGSPASNFACGGNFWDGRAEGRGKDVGGALFAGTASKHVGVEVFQGSNNSKIRQYAQYFGPTADQALNPMPNPVEHNISRQAVCRHVERSAYAELYEDAWGERIKCDSNRVRVKAIDVSSETNYDISFKRMMVAVSAWQHSYELNSFTSKRDFALREELACKDGGAGPYAKYYNWSICAREPSSNWGKFPLVGLTASENLGHDLFFNVGVLSAPKNPSLPAANCAACHVQNPSTDDGTKLKQLYTNMGYHNIGVPANPQLPAAPSKGLSGHATDVSPGMFKTPTLRNVDKRPYWGFVKAYMHNGWFKSLEQIVHFYNTGDVNGETAAKFGITRCPAHVTSAAGAMWNNCWPAPEWTESAVFSPVIGDMGMSRGQEKALVDFLKALTDSYTATPPQSFISRK